MNKIVCLFGSGSKVKKTSKIGVSVGMCGIGCAWVKWVGASEIGWEWVE
jgi:hypothetical protein